MTSSKTVEVTIGGPDASVANSGVTINMQTRTGSNDARASARALWLDRGLQSPSQLDPEEVPAGQGDFLLRRFASLRELGVEGGGPVGARSTVGLGFLQHHRRAQYEHNWYPRQDPAPDILRQAQRPARSRTAHLSRRLSPTTRSATELVPARIAGLRPSGGRVVLSTCSRRRGAHVFSSTFYLSALASVVDSRLWSRAGRWLERRRFARRQRRLARWFRGYRSRTSR